MVGYRFKVGFDLRWRQPAIRKISVVVPPQRALAAKRWIFLKAPVPPTPVSPTAIDLEPRGRVFRGFLGGASELDVVVFRSISHLTP